MAAPLLALTGVHSGYGRSEVLFDIDLAVAPGEIVGVLGRNGMGKTTLVRTVMGLLAPSAGRDPLRRTRDRRTGAPTASPAPASPSCPRAVRCSRT